MNFLQFNDSFKIILFNSFLVEHEKQSIMDKIPEFVSGYCGSIWIESKRPGSPLCRGGDVADSVHHGMMDTIGMR